MHSFPGTIQSHKFKRWVKIFQGSSIRSRLARGVTWSTAGSVVAQGSSLLTAMVVAQRVGIAAFGGFVLVQSTALMLQSVGSLGLGLATTRQVARLRTQDPRRTGRIIGFALLFTVLAGILLAGLAFTVPSAMIQSLLRTDHLDTMMRWVGLIACSFMISRIQADILVGLEAFRVMAAVHVVRGITTLLLTSLGAYGFGLTGAIIAFVGAGLITCIISQVMITQACRSCGIALTWRNVHTEIHLLGTSLFVTASSLTLALVTWILSVLLVRQEQGLAELALFNAADRWRTAILFLPSMLAQVSLPLLAHTYTQERRSHYRRLLWESSGVGLLITAIPAITIILLAPLVMSGYGAAFAPGKPVLMLLAVTCLPMSLCMIGAYGLWAAGKMATMLSIDIMRGAIALSYCLLKSHFTAYDVAMGTLLSYLATTPLIALALIRLLASHKDEACLTVGSTGVEPL